MLIPSGKAENKDAEYTCWIRNTPLLNGENALFPSSPDAAASGATTLIAADALLSSEQQQIKKMLNLFIFFLNGKHRCGLDEILHLAVTFV